MSQSWLSWLCNKNNKNVLCMWWCKMKKYLVLFESLFLLENTNLSLMIYHFWKWLAIYFNTQSWFDVTTGTKHSFIWMILNFLKLLFYILLLIYTFDNGETSKDPIHNNITNIFYYTNEKQQTQLEKRFLFELYITNTQKIDLNLLKNFWKTTNKMKDKNVNIIII
jgi:hypothetical protein